MSRKNSPAMTEIKQVAARLRSGRCDWRDLITASPEAVRMAMRKKELSRLDVLKLVARRAYEVALIGQEVATIWKALKGYRNLSSGEMAQIAISLPSPMVNDALWSHYHPIHKQRQQALKRREIVRRRRNLAKLAAGNKPSGRTQKGVLK